MLQLILTAFTIGLLGSFHCVGMCGPLALSLPLNNDNAGTRFTGAILYNAGRIITYSFFGFLFGILGKSIAFFGFQQKLSIVLGIVILLFMVIPRRETFLQRNSLFLHYFEMIRAALGKLYFKKRYSSLILIGLLNGLLPCGLVYIAIAGSLATGSIVNSIIFMAFFGLGTLPMMWSVAFFGTFMKAGLRQRIRKVYPYMVSLMACLLILRGMGLGIPYVSPKADANAKTVHSCCARPH